MALNPRQKLFVSEYIVDFNGTQAAIRAGYIPSSAGSAAFELLTNPAISDAVSDKLQERLDIAELSVDWVLRQWKKIAEADPAELCWTEIECCRYCYGEGHAYQWTEPEYKEALYFSRNHVCNPRCKFPCKFTLVPQDAGGMGFDPRRAPAADCPICAGKGIERVRIADTRHVKGSARRLFAGVKQTKDGIEIKMRDQDAALQNISKYFGMMLERRELDIKVSQLPPGTTAQDLTDDQLAQYIHQEQQRELSAGNTIEGEIMLD